MFSWLVIAVSASVLWMILLRLGPELPAGSVPAM